MKIISPRFRAARGDRKPKEKSSLFLHLGAIALLLVAFFAAFLTLFPSDALRARAEHMIRQQTGETVSIGKLSLRPLLSLRSSDVSWSPALEPWPNITIPEMRLSPRWSALFTASPGLNFKTQLIDGRLDGFYVHNTELFAEIEDASITPYFPESLGYLPHGTLNGSLTSDGDPALDSTESRFDMRLDQAAVTGLERLGTEQDRLNLGTIRLQGTMQGRNLKIEDLSAAGGDLQVDGKATILVAKTPQQSRINAQIAVTPSTNLDSGLRDLLTLSGVTPDRNGTFNFRLSGSLAQPALR